MSTKLVLLLDGFPRTKVQVECLKLFHQKLDHLRALYRETDLDLSS